MACLDWVSCARPYRNMASHLAHAARDAHQRIGRGLAFGGGSLPPRRARRSLPSRCAQIIVHLAGQPGDVLGGLPGAARPAWHLIGHHGKAAAGFSCAPPQWRRSAPADWSARQSRQSPGDSCSMPASRWANTAKCPPAPATACCGLHPAARMARPLISLAWLANNSSIGGFIAGLAGGQGNVVYIPG